VSLPDLATEDSNILSMWKSWIVEMVANYTIDGVRMDSCYEMDYAFFEPFQEAGTIT
jgi:alpha-amylase